MLNVEYVAPKPNQSLINAPGKRAEVLLHTASAKYITSLIIILAPIRQFNLSWDGFSLDLGVLPTSLSFFVISILFFISPTSRPTAYKFI